MIDYFAEVDQSIFKKGLVSIVLPTYNSACYINRALSSVIEQTYTNFEIIVIDDGSIDGTFTVITPFLGDQRIRYLYQENHGRSFARNQAIKESQGEFIAFLDADDEWLPNFLDLSVQVISSNVQVGYSYSWGNIYNIADCRFVEKFQGKQKNGLVTKKDMFRELIMGGKVLFDSIVLRRSVLKLTGGLDTRISVAEDWDFTMRLAANYDGYCISEPLVNVYANFQHRKNYQRRENFEMYLMVFDNLKKSNLDEESQKLIDQSLGQELFTRGSVLLARGNIQESSRLIAQAYDTNPSFFHDEEFSLSFAYQFLKFYDSADEFVDLIKAFSQSMEQCLEFSSVFKSETIISSIYGLIVIKELQSPKIIFQSAIKAVKYDFWWLQRKEFLINGLKAVYHIVTGAT